MSSHLIDFTKTFTYNCNYWKLSIWLSLVAGVGQCVADSARCNQRLDCRDSSDEEGCFDDVDNRWHQEARFPPAVVDMDGPDGYTIQPIASLSQCPHTHFLCPGW